jgi:hypothetical protein
MNKSIIKFFISMTLAFSAFLNAAESNTYQQPNNHVHCAPQLSRHLATIRQLDQGQLLIDQVTKEGPLTIQVADNRVTKNFSACWDGARRIILIGLASRPSDGEIIASLLFELHNAVMTSHLDNLDNLAQQKAIDKGTYVRNVEHVEYMNSIKSSKLAQMGVQQGLFPKNTYLHVYKDFNEYLHYQQISGHSAIIAENYELLMRYNNT